MTAPISRLQRGLIAEPLAESEAQTGPLPQEMLDRAAQAFRTAEALADHGEGLPDPEEGSVGTRGDVARPQCGSGHGILLLDGEGAVEGDSGRSADDGVHQGRAVE